MARDHCPPAVKDIEHANFAATAVELFAEMVLGGANWTAPTDMKV
jgi:hypothetical protein